MEAPRFQADGENSQFILLTAPRKVLHERNLRLKDSLTHYAKHPEKSRSRYQESVSYSYKSMQTELPSLNLVWETCWLIHVSYVGLIFFISVSFTSQNFQTLKHKDLGNRKPNKDSTTWHSQGESTPEDAGPVNDVVRPHSFKIDRVEGAGNCQMVEMKVRSES